MGGGGGPQEVNEWLMLNTLEIIIPKGLEFWNKREQAPNMVQILQGLIEYTNCTEIQSLVQRCPKLDAYGGQN